MKHRAARNYLKTHRLKSGLSQRELGNLLGYKDAGQISRHELSKSLPPLTVALGYEAIFRVSITAIFADIRESIGRDIEERVLAMQKALKDRDGRDRDANMIARKLVWLNQRSEH